MAWSLHWTPKAERQFWKLLDREQKAIQSSLDEMLHDLSLVDINKLSGRKNEWRLRVGRWRIILGFENKTGIIWVLRILPRKEAY
jgi:mRNA-degrading endonuclease RelE of RelBE toxin-antitoxin system